MSDFLDKAKDTIGGLADKVEGAIPDSVKETASKAKDKTGELAGKAGDAIPDSVKETASKAKDKTGELAGKAGGAIKDVVEKVTGDKDEAAPARAPPAPAPSSARQPQPSRRIASPSASRARPFQRNVPGVFDSRAMTACIGVPSTSTIALRSATCGSAATSAMSYTGPTAASAASIAAITSLACTHRAPVGHARLHLVAVAHPGAERGEALVAADAEQVCDAERDRVAARRDPDPLPVGAPVRAPRHRVGQARPQPRLLLAGDPVQRRRAAP